MGRVQLRVLAALGLFAIAGAASAAEVTRIASSFEPGDPFDLDVQIRWERLQERGRIAREVLDPTRNPPFGSIEELTELRYRRVRNAMVPRIAVGVFRDLEVHAEIPIVFADDTSWRYGRRNGVPLTAATSSVALNGIDANGAACAAPPCPLFGVGAGTTVFHGGVLGDLKAGVSWGVFDDRDDDTKPFWLLGVDVTFPTAERYDPAADRRPSSFASTASPDDPAAIGEKVWKLDLRTAFSRRIGPFDPYVTANVTLMRETSDTYSNCEHAAELAGMSPARFSALGAANCELSRWRDEAGADLPWLAGLAFGTEVVPWEDARAGKALTLDLRFGADWTSDARWYNPLTDATGRLLHTESHVTFGGQLGLRYRGSRFVAWQATASLATQTPYFLTGEPVGTPGGEGQNPNYDPRWDAPGTRFRMTESAIFGMTFAGVVQF